MALKKTETGWSDVKIDSEAHAIAKARADTLGMKLYAWIGRAIRREAKREEKRCE